MAETLKGFIDIFPTEWGWAGAAYSTRGLEGLVLPRTRRDETEKLLVARFGGGRRKRVWAELRAAVGGYFRGQEALLDLPLDVNPPGAFTARIWRAAMAIPYGRTDTYGGVARRAGSPAAARATGAALGRNPVPLFIPCHRVLASAGPGGFSAGGGAMKRRLLLLESRRFRMGGEKS